MPIPEPIPEPPKTPKTPKIPKVEEAHCTMHDARGTRHEARGTKTLPLVKDFWFKVGRIRNSHNVISWDQNI